MILTLIHTIITLIGIIVIIRYWNVEEKDIPNNFFMNSTAVAVLYVVNFVLTFIYLVIIGITHIPNIHKRDVMEIESRRAALVLRLEVMNSTDDASLISDIV